MRTSIKTFAARLSIPQGLIKGFDAGSLFILYCSPAGVYRFISETGPVLRCALMMDAISS